MSFFIIAIVLLILSLASLIVPLIKKSSPRNATSSLERSTHSSDEAISILKKEHQQGLIDEDHQDAIIKEAHATVELEQQQNIDDKKEVKDRRPNMFFVVLLCIIFPVVSVLVYLTVGSPQSLLLSPANNAQRNAPMSGLPDGKSVNDMVAQLEQKLSDDPNDVEGWSMLARSYMVLKDYDNAILAFKKINELTPNNANVLASYADAKIMSNDGAFDTQTQELLAQALSIDPQQTQALWLSGLLAMKNEDYSIAVRFFTQVKQLTEDERSLSVINGLIDAAQSKLEQAP